jgi:hypothetical protein
MPDGYARHRYLENEFLEKILGVIAKLDFGGGKWLK